MAQQVHLTLDAELIKDLLIDTDKTALKKLYGQVIDQLLKAEATEQIGAQSYERNDNRTTQRNGYRTRCFTTRVGALELHIPKLRDGTFSTKLFHNYARSEQALQAAIFEMVISGVSTRKVTDIFEELCGTSISKSTVSELTKSLDDNIKEFKDRPLGEFKYLIADAIYVNVRENKAVVSKCLMVAIGITPNGTREVVGFEANNSENEETWKAFFSSLVSRGLNKITYAVSDDHCGLKNAIKQTFAGVTWQRCQAHFERNILGYVPEGMKYEFKRKIKDMFNANTCEEARIRKDGIMAEYKDNKALSKALKCLDNGFDEVTAVFSLPLHHQIKMRTSNMIERVNEELRRRERVIRIFPNTESVERILGAILLETHEKWAARKYMEMDNQ